MITWYRKAETYKNYWHMEKKVYPYKIFFYEKEGDTYSCKDKFPITCTDKTIFTKDTFIDYVRNALDQINDFNIGISFEYKGYEPTDRDDLAFLTKDGINAIVYYFNYKWGGLSAPFSKNEFGIKIDLVNNVKKEWFVGCIRHEMTHALGFAHKDDDFKGLKGQIVINGFDGLGEFSADTIHGIKAVYDIESKFVINGQTDTVGTENAQIFIYDAKTKNILYQSPIDNTGYFEFRIDNAIKKFNILAIGKKEKKYWFGKLNKDRTLGRMMKGYRFEELKLNNYCDGVGYIKDRLGIIL